MVAGVILTVVVSSPVATVEAQTEVTPNPSDDFDQTTLAVSVRAPETTTDRWPNPFGEQIAQVLRKRGPMAKQAVMLDVISTTSTEEGKIDLGPALPPLLRIAQEDSSQEHREMALRAIAAIGREHSSERLYGDVIDQLRSPLQAESSERLRRLRRMVVRDFDPEKEESKRPPMPTVPEHDVETRLIEVRGDLDETIGEDLERLEEATIPPMPTVPEHEVETRLVELEGDLDEAIEEDLERLEKATIPPMPKVPVHKVENRLIETEGNLDQSIEEDLKRLEETSTSPLLPHFSPDDSLRLLHRRNRY